MSKNEHPKSPEQAGQKKQQPHRKPDERIRRTCERLGGALITLIQERPIDDVTVQDVLDRAAVGRSTFYLHFRDKNDLLLSQLEKFLEFMSSALSVRKEKSLRVVPVAEMFAHIGSQKKLYRALADSGRLNEFFDLAQGYFARGIERRLMESGRLANLPQRELAPRSSALAGSLLSLLRWWLDRGAKESPRAMDELFHQMVWSGLQSSPSLGEKIASPNRPAVIDLRPRNR
ncbi:MAG TPA: helix-turn-helix domain-containing protein [Candidatus Sulfotelmatobacter sp.]